jgi:hypothetical protein
VRPARSAITAALTNALVSSLAVGAAAQEEDPLAPAAVLGWALGDGRGGSSPGQRSAAKSFPPTSSDLARIDQAPVDIVHHSGHYLGFEIALPTAERRRGMERDHPGGWRFAS